MYITGKHKLYLNELYKQVEKQTFGDLFCPVSQRVQMNFIFSDNVSILCTVYPAMLNSPRQLTAK